MKSELQEMRNKPITIKHICGHETHYYRYDTEFLKWAELAKNRTCGNLQCRVTFHQ